MITNEDLLKEISSDELTQLSDLNANNEIEIALLVLKIIVELFCKSKLMK